MSDINSIAGDLGDTYFIVKESEKLRDSLRTEFFDAAKEAQAKESLAQKTWTSPEASGDPTALALKYNPGWLIESVEEDRVILVEDPDFKQVSVTATGERDTYVVTKQIRSGSTLVDDERLQKDDPILWENVSYIPGLDVLSEWIPDKHLDDIAEKLGLKRQLRNPNDLTPEDVEAIKPYVYEGKKTKALTVKVSKDEE